jgi:hypothetical protein
VHSVPSSDAAFVAAAQRLAQASVRPEFEIEQAPAPQRLAPHALTFVADAVPMGGPLADLSESATGRFVLLHDPDGVDEWAGTFRVVVFARCDVEPEILGDPLIHEVAWSWVTETLETLPAAQVGGTVTISAGTSFGTMAERPGDGLVEIRASWTPLPTEDGHDVPATITDHLDAWIEIVARLAGLPPLPAGVPHMAAHRSRSS